jgi:hypothetical protein
MNVVDKFRTPTDRSDDNGCSAYEALFGHFSLPKFAGVHEERQHRKQRLVAGFGLFAAFGSDEGASGHMTARDREFPDTFWVNPFGMHFSQIRVSDLVRVDVEGHVVEGVKRVNVSAFAIHSQVHRAIGLCDHQTF